MPDLDKNPASPSAAGSNGSDWPAQATEAIVGVVDSVKDKVNGPATKAARGVVYGTLAGLVGTATLVVVLVLLFRGVDIIAQVILDAIDVERAGRSTWITHLVFGLAMLLPGVWLWRKGTRAPAAA